MFNTKCQYAPKCEAYRDDSYTCIRRFDKYYCGIYKLFAENKIEIYTAGAISTNLVTQECINRLR